MKLVLASSSPRRKELLAKISTEFKTAAPPEEAEEPISGGGASAAPEEFAKRNALLKAMAVARTEDGDSIIIGADTIVVSEGHIMGKPAGAEEAARMLRALSGKTHEVITGIAVTNNATGRTISSFERTEVEFKELSDREIDEYVASGEPIGKAGAYAIQGLASRFIPGIRGCFFNVVGLPVFRLNSMIMEVSES